MAKKNSAPQTPFQKFVRTYLLWVVFGIIVIIIVGGYLLGYRFGPGMKLNQEGTLTLTNLPTGTSVFIDQVLVDTVSATSTESFDLVSGSHTVIVSANNDYPWNNLVSIASGKKTALNPIFISLQPDATPLTGTEKTAAIAAVASTTLPTQAAPLILRTVVRTCTYQIIK